MPFDSTLDVDADAWLCVLSLNGRRPATLKSYEACARRLAQFVNHPLRDVSRPEALAFVSYMRERYKPGGVALYVRTLRGFYNWCVEEGIVQTNPFARLKVAIPKQIKPTPSDAEVDAMLRKAVRHRRDYAMLALLADTGCRKGEIAALADTINGMIDTLATFADQVTTVAREGGVEGKLGGQARVPGAVDHAEPEDRVELPEQPVGEHPQRRDHHEADCGRSAGEPEPRNGRRPQRRKHDSADAAAVVGHPQSSRSAPHEPWRNNAVEGRRAHRAPARTAQKARDEELPRLLRRSPSDHAGRHRACARLSHARRAVSPVQRGQIAAGN